MSEQPPPQGWLANLLHFAKNLTLQQVLTIGLLIALLAPTYLLYTAINDQALMGRLLSSYEEITSDKIPCTLRIASVKGGGDRYAISTGFAYQGSDTWVVSAIMDRKPTTDELYSYCATLGLLVDFMRRPDAKSPTYPDSDKPLIWTYPSAQ